MYIEGTKVFGNSVYPKHKEGILIFSVVFFLYATYNYLSQFTDLLIDFDLQVEKHCPRESLMYQKKCKGMLVPAFFL